MVSKQELLGLTEKARERTAKKNFVQSIELAVALKGLNVKKDRDALNINEVVALPHPLPQRPKVCAVATGELAMKLKQSALAERVLSGDEIDTFAANKRAGRKLAKEFDFFVAEPSLMPKVGRVLGPILGPRGKMPIPLPPAAAASDAIVVRLRSSTRVRGRGQLSLSCKIGSEDMTDEQLAENALAAIDMVEKKLPQGRRNIHSVFIKLTMGEPVKMAVVS